MSAAVPQGIQARVVCVHGGKSSNEGADDMWLESGVGFGFDGADVCVGCEGACVCGLDVHGCVLQGVVHADRVVFEAVFHAHGACEVGGI